MLDTLIDRWDAGDAPPNFKELYDVAYRLAVSNCRLILRTHEEACEVAWETAGDFVLLIESGWRWGMPLCPEIDNLLGHRVTLLNGDIPGGQKSYQWLLTKLARQRADAVRQQRNRDSRRFCALAQPHMELPELRHIDFRAVLEEAQFQSWVLGQMHAVSRFHRDLLQDYLRANSCQAEVARQRKVSEATISRKFGQACKELREQIDD